jgi:hypothetical protein
MSGPTATDRLADIAAIQEALLLWYQRGAVIEIRVPKAGRARTVSGYYDDLDTLARDAVTCNRKYGNVYATIQTIDPSLLARRKNRYEELVTETTADTNVASYRWLPFDIDPVRAPGISATDAEHTAALGRADVIRQWLVEHGWPDAMVVDSGNGAYVLPHIDLPVTAESKQLVQRCLRALDSRFSDEEVKVDTSTYNPARVLKIPGTVAKKGDDVPDRPHRRSRLIHKPAAFDIVPRERLEALAALAPEEARFTGMRSNGRVKDLAAWMAAHGVTVRRTKDWNGAVLHELDTCPFNPEHRDGEARIIQFPSGALDFGCFHDSCQGKKWRELRALYGEHAGTHGASGGERSGGPSPADASPADGPPYFTTDHGTFWRKPTKDGPVATLLATFHARITGEVIRDDGVETTRAYEIEGAVAGRPPRRFTIPAGQFATMNWPLEHLGVAAVLSPGLGARDHCRAAIQLLSGDVNEHHVYTHTGWREVDGKQLYLSAAGAIGQVGQVPAISIELSGPLAGYLLPAPPEGQALQAAVRASLAGLEVAPDPITAPVLGATYRAVLGSADFGVHVAGHTGAGKSELAALAQQHYGPAMDARRLPAGWSSTANALESLAFSAKDALLTVDDFAPGGTATDVARLHAAADRLFRAQGNNSGRQRMRADTSLREPKPPRGLILSTGEDVPRGQSIRARLLVVEMAGDDLDWSGLAVHQQNAASGRFAEALAGFVQYLAGEGAAFRAEHRTRVRRLRDEATRSDQHRRTPVIIAELAAGWDAFLTFANACGAITAEESGALHRRTWQALGAAAAAQAAHQRAAEPAGRFIELLRAAFVSGRAHVASAYGTGPADHSLWGWREVDTRDGTELRPLGNQIGWVSGEDLYLEPAAAFAIAQRLAQETGEGFAITMRTLHKRLSERGFLKSVPETRESLAIRKVLAGQRRNVLHLDTAPFVLPQPDQPDQPDGEGPPQGDPESGGGAPWSGSWAGSVAPSRKPAHETCPPDGDREPTDGERGQNGQVGQVSLEAESQPVVVGERCPGGCGRLGSARADGRCYACAAEQEDVP